MIRSTPPSAASLQSRQIQFERLLEDNRGILFKVAYLYCGDPEDRRDLLQEMGTQLWKSFASYDPERPFSTWMYRVALNVAISQVRSTAIRQRHMTEAAEAEIEQVQSEADELAADERLGALQHFIAGLDDLNKALVLLYLEDYDHSAIAKILGISRTNVATKIGRLKQRIRREIS